MSTYNPPSKPTSSTPTPSANASGAKAALKMSTSGGKGLEGRKPGSPMDPQQKKPATPSAWQRGSTNPLTNRASGPVLSNGVANNTSKPASLAKGPPVPPKDSNNPGKQASERMALLLGHSAGLTAIITLKNGERYTGILSSSTSTSRYTIRMAKKLPGAGKQPNGTTEESVGNGQDRAMDFDIEGVADITLENVRFEKPKAQNGVSSTFKTDTDISTGRPGRQRELQKWSADAGTSDIDGSLDSKGNTAWDQFNGKETTYNEELYTTRINKDAPDYDQRLAKARQLEKEIQNSSTQGNRHVAEERGVQMPEDNGVDEETKYSGVQRNADFQSLSSGQSGKYIPPVRRGAPSGQPPADPAIIASSRPEPPSAVKPPPVQAESVDAKVTQPADVKATKAAEPTGTTEAKPKPTEEKVAPAKATQSSIPPLQYPRGQNKEGGATETVEKDVVNAFKQFTTMEKMRVQEHQRSQARKDKAVKLNDLKKFAENFKLNTEVPPDLVPILAKDKRKQKEIVDKAKQQAVDGPTKTPPTRSSTSTAVTPTTEQRVAKAAADRAVQPGHTSPLAPSERPNRARKDQQSQSLRGPSAGNQQLPTRPPPGNLGGRLAFQQQQNQHRQGAPAMGNLQPGYDSRLPPTGPSATSSGLTSPTGPGPRWNVKANAFTPNPNSQAFVPTPSNPSTGSSPVRGEPANRPPERKVPKPGNFFAGRRAIMAATDRPSISTAFNPIVRMKKEVVQKGEQDRYSDNGGIPQAFKTGPTWPTTEENANKTYADMFQKSPPNMAAVAHHNANMSQQPYQNQLPHFQSHPPGQMHMGHTPHQTPRHHSVQPHHGGPGTPHHYDDNRMQFSQSTSSVQPSPRMPQQFMQPYVQGQPGQFFQQPMPAYGIQGGGQPMMYRQVSSGGGPQFVPNMQMAGQMGGGMMANPQPGGQFTAMPPYMYPSPMQGQAFPQHPNGMQGQPGSSGYPSPRGPAQMVSVPGPQGGHPPPPPGQPIYVLQNGQQAQMYPSPGQVPMRVPFQGPHQHQYGASPHYPQPPQPHRGTPSGSFVQPMMMTAGPPQGMPPSGPPMVPEGASNET